MQNSMMLKTKAKRNGLINSFRKNSIIGKLAITFCFVSLLSGCLSQQVNRGVSSNLVSYLYPKGEMVSHSSDRLLHLSLPLKVGVAFIPESTTDRSFSLSELEKQKLLLSVTSQFRQDKAISKIQIIPELYLRQGKGFVTLEQVSRLYDVDVIALVSYDQMVVNELNRLSLAYWTIVGAYIVPGESTEVQTFVDTAVFDIQSKKMLFRAPGVHQDARSHTAIGHQQKTRAKRYESFEKASNEMANNLSLELEKFKRRVKSGEAAKVSYRGGSGGGSWGIVGVVFLMLLIRFSSTRKR
jgi:rhombotail lipoprotein